MFDGKGWFGYYAAGSKNGGEEGENNIGCCETVCLVYADFSLRNVKADSHC